MDLDNLFQAFRFADIQTALTIKHVLDRSNISWGDFEKWVKDKSTKIPRKQKPRISSSGCSGCQSKKRHILRNCPDCDTRMLLFDVNTMPCNQVGGALARQWICPNCEREDFE